MEKLRRIKEEYLKLPEDKRKKLLAYLLFFFSQTARSSYIDAGNTESTSVMHLRMFNEVTQAISTQILVKIGAEPVRFGYPDDVFFDVLKETFDKASLETDSFISIIYDAFREVLKK